MVDHGIQKMTESPAHGELCHMMGTWSHPSGNLQFQSNVDPVVLSGEQGCSTFTGVTPGALHHTQFLDACTIKLEGHNTLSVCHHDNGDLWGSRHDLWGLYLKLTLWLAIEACCQYWDVPLCLHE